MPTERTEGTLRRDFYREGTYHDLVILSVFRDGAPEASHP
jgi:hypothetical protein